VGSVFDARYILRGRSQKQKKAARTAAFSKIQKE
jgi:hypothetical protein